MSSIGSLHWLEVGKKFLGLKSERQLLSIEMKWERAGWFRGLASLGLHKTLQTVLRGWIRKQLSPANRFKIRLITTPWRLSTGTSSWCLCHSVLLKASPKIEFRWPSSLCLERGFGQKRFLTQTPANLIGTDPFENIKVCPNKELQKSWVCSHRWRESTWRVQFASLFFGCSSQFSSPGSPRWSATVKALSSRLSFAVASKSKRPKQVPASQNTNWSLPCRSTCLFWS